MNWSKKALELMRKFSAGVSCPKWDETTIENTGFYPHCADIARKMYKTEIDEEVVRDYILKVHNSVTVKIGIIGKESFEAIQHCMVRPQETESVWICMHGSKEVMPISLEEAKTLERGNKELLKSLQ